MLSFPSGKTSGKSSNSYFDFSRSNGNDRASTTPPGVPNGKRVNGTHEISSMESLNDTAIRVTRVTTKQYAKLKSDFIQEMRLLSKLRHPCITTVMGAVLSSGNEPLLVMELMDHGSLFDLLHNDSMVVEGDIVLQILRDVAQGLRFLHAATPQVVHGDLKAQNILVDSKFRAKVADFGLSQKKGVGAAGTPFWMAPELLNGASSNTAASDVYSFGIILYEVYSRKIPYEGEDFEETINQIRDPYISKRPPVPKSMPPEIVTLMNACTNAHPDIRPPFRVIDDKLKAFNVASVEPGILYFSLQQKKAWDTTLTASENLLLDIFPKHVAQALSKGQKVEPQHFDCVTIFFSDIVSFTEICHKLTPLKVSDMLDRLYTKFDNLSRKHDVFKVETIGDAWMGVTNVATQQPDHAKRIAVFAMDAIKEANRTLIDEEDCSRGFVKIRVGFHSGPVIANVVGARNPKYTLIGDTVNTSARMESNSQPGRILCSARAAKLLQEQAPELTVVSRGIIDVKGKGSMEAFWVAEARPPEEEKIDL
ncbi:guanylate cyclase [Fragilaria crotonensis]|nr:guanylate cyclase [Fragilaria crotonensis]